MNKSELESLLRKARTPEISDESLDSFPGKVISSLNRTTLPDRRLPIFSPRLAWAMGVVALVLLTFVIGHRYARTGISSSLAKDSLSNAKLVNEMMSVFPNRLRAIVQDDRGLSVILSEGEDVPVSKPLYIRVCEGTGCSSFVTFSGQVIEVGGQKWTVLSDPRGGIILTGDQFVWTSSQRIDEGNHFKIQASILDSSSM